MNKIIGGSVTWLLVTILSSSTAWIPALGQPANSSAEAKLLGRWHNGDGFEMEFRHSGPHIVGVLVKIPSGFEGRQTVGANLFSGGVASGQQVKGLWQQFAGKEYGKLPSLHVPATISFKDAKTINLATFRAYVGAQTHAITGEHRNVRWLKDRDPVTYNWFRLGPSPAGNESLVTADDFKDHVLSGKNGKKSVFDRMDKDGNGCLSDAEVAAAVSNPEFKGKDAEAVSVIYNNPDISSISPAKGDHQCPGISKDDVALINKDDSNKKHILETLNTMRDIKDKSKGKLFGPGDSVNAGGVIQGAVGDCNFLSPLSSWADTPEGKKSIREMIKPAGKDKDGNDQYTVTFHDPKNPSKTIDVTVAKPTESELINYAKGTGNGTWAATIEKAYGKYRSNHDQYGNVIGQTVADGQPLQLGAGGSTTAKNAITLLTGKQANSVSINSFGQSLTDLDKDLTKAFTGNKPIMTAGIEGHGEGAMKKPWYAKWLLQPAGGLDGEKSATSGLTAGHEFSVLNYDPKTQQVTMRNPYGYNEASKDPSMASKDGTFKMPLKDFQQNFSHYTLAK